MCLRSKVSYEAMLTLFLLKYVIFCWATVAVGRGATSNGQRCLYSERYELASCTFGSESNDVSTAKGRASTKFDFCTFGCGSNVVSTANVTAHQTVPFAVETTLCDVVCHRVG